MKLDIIYEDNDIVAVNKPAGILSIPHRFDKDLPSLYHEVAKKYEKLFIVHRIDKDTSGVIIFAKNDVAHRHFSMAFQNREVAKKYHAFCIGRPVEESADINGSIMEHPTIKGKMVINRRGKVAHSRYKVLKSWNGYSHIEVEIFTGRTHQIRVHMQSVGTPLVCDEIYGNGQPLFLSDFKKKFNEPGNHEEQKPLLGRLALHSYELKIQHVTGEPLVLVAPLPKDFRATINQLDKWSTFSKF